MSSALPGFRCLVLLNLRAVTCQHAKQIHAQLINNGLRSQSVISKLIEQYCAASSPRSTKLANLVFTQFDPTNLFLFNTLLKCYPPTDSMRLFANRVSKNQSEFDDHTFVFVFGACARSGSVSTLSFGRQVHGHALKYGLLSDHLLVQTTLIHFYGNNRDICSARRMFDEMPDRSIVTFNAMISAYSSQKEKSNYSAREALTLFRVLAGDHLLTPNDTTLVCILTAASRIGVLETGSCVHGYIQKSGFEPKTNVFIGTGLIDMYSKSGCLKNALSLFNMMMVKNVLTWTSMATGLAFHGRGEEALNLLDEMRGFGLKPNEVTFTSLLSACCHAGLVQEGLRLFHKMKKRFGISPRVQHYGCIVDLLGRAGLIEEAYEFISTMPSEPDGILWRSLLNACRVHGNVAMGEKIGRILLGIESEPSSVVLSRECEDFVALSNVYASLERWGQVEIVRKEMKERGIGTKPGSSLVQTMSSHRF